MGEQGKTTNSRNMHAIILALDNLGDRWTIKITIHGAPLRGSGFGTIFTILGFLLLVIAFLRFYYKRPS